MKPVAFIRTSPESRDNAPQGNSYTPPLSLDEHFVSHPAATFFVRVGEDVAELDELDVCVGDVLVVDRVATPHVSSLVMVVRAGELCLGRMATLEYQEDVTLWGTVIALARRV